MFIYSNSTPILPPSESGGGTIIKIYIFYSCNVIIDYASCHLFFINRAQKEKLGLLAFLVLQ